MSDDPEESPHRVATASSSCRALLVGGPPQIVSDTYDAALFRAHGGIAAADDDPCAPRHIPTATGAYFDRLRALAPFSAEGLPPVWPYSMSYASTKPSDAAAFVEQYMGGT